MFPDKSLMSVLSTASKFVSSGSLRASSDIVETLAPLPTACAALASLVLRRLLTTAVKIAPKTNSAGKKGNAIRTDLELPGILLNQGLDDHSKRSSLCKPRGL